MFDKIAITGALLFSMTTTANAAELITNGGFETGDYTGWQANVQSGSEGNVQVVPSSSGNSPLSNFAFAANPNGGQFFSITDQNGPGSYAVTQAFTLATAQTVRITFDMFANNQSDPVAANGRDYNTDPNQNAVVDILTGGAGAFTDSATDIVAVLYGPGADTGANPNPWTSYSFNLALNAGTYQIRFAETDNQGFFQQGIDNVSVTSSVPEPATWAMMIGGFAVVGAAMRRRQAATSFA